jgi:hypothetical protein
MPIGGLGTGIWLRKEQYYMYFMAFQASSSAFSGPDCEVNSFTTEPPDQGKQQESGQKHRAETLPSTDNECNSVGKRKSSGVSFGSPD